RTETAQRGTDRLPHDGGLANAGVADAQQAVLLLQSRAALIHIAELADILTEDDDARIAPQCVIETMIEDLEAVQHRRVIRVLDLHLRHTDRRLRAFAVKMLCISLVAGALLLTQPRCCRGITTGEDHGRGQRAHRIAAERRLRPRELAANRFELALARRAGGHRVDEFDRALHIGIDRRAVRIPRAPLGFPHRLQILALELIELFARRDSLPDHPLAHLANAVVLDLPLEPLFRLVALV